MATPVSVVVCGTDLTAASQQAALGAAIVARHFGADLVLVHVVPGPEQMQAAHAALKRFAHERIGDPAPLPVVRAGDPARELGRLARQERADLVIVGARRTEPLFHVGVAAGLLETAPCPVLVFTDAETDARALIRRVEGWSAAPSRCAVCGAPAGERVCTSCRARITWEVMEGRWHGHPGR